MNQVRKAKILVSVLVLGCFITTSTACYGPFKLTQKLHSWNGTLGSKWINELVFFALVVIPAYELCTLGDAIIFNSIQFWTGSNPIADGSAGQGAKTEQLADGNLQVHKDGKIYQLRMDPDTHAVSLLQGGRVVVRAERTAAGGVAVHDLEKGKTAEISPDQARSVSEQSALLAALSLDD